MTHKIIDYYLPDEYFKTLKDAIVRNEHFPWCRINELNVFKTTENRDVYFAHIKSVVLTQKISKIFSFKGLNFSQPWKDWYSTKYEEKAKKAGRRSYYMVLKKIIVNSHI